MFLILQEGIMSSRSVALSLMNVSSVQAKAHELCATLRCTACSADILRVVIKACALPCVPELVVPTVDPVHLPELIVPITELFVATSCVYTAVSALSRASANARAYAVSGARHRRVYLSVAFVVGIVLYSHSSRRWSGSGLFHLVFVGSP